eukprot:scaffold55805_cov20-Tisochrysis_lutea.AAC.2
MVVAPSTCVNLGVRMSVLASVAPKMWWLRHGMQCVGLVHFKWSCKKGRTLGWCDALIVAFQMLCAIVFLFLIALSQVAGGLDCCQVQWHGQDRGRGAARWVGCMREH